MKTTLLLGGSGRLGRSIQEELRATQIPFFCPTRHELDVRDLVSVRKFISEHNINLVIHAASILTPRTASVSQAIIDSEFSTKMDNNVFRVVHDENLQLIFLSTALIYSARDTKTWTESDFGTPPNPPQDRQHYSLMKYESTHNILTLAAKGINCSAIVLPNLLAGPIPTLERNDQLCEKLFNLSRIAASSGVEEICFNVEVNPKLQLVAGIEIAKWLSLVINLELNLPPLLNIASKQETTPVELLREILIQKFPQVRVILEGTPKLTSSYLLSDSLARKDFFWSGGESLVSSVKEWISDPFISSQALLSPKKHA